MNRRQFLAASGAAGLVPLAGSALTNQAQAQMAGAAPAGAGRDFFEVRQYLIDNEDQKKQLDAYFKDAAIPALNRAGIKPVGAFYPDKLPKDAAQGLNTILYVLLRAKSPADLLGAGAKLLADGDFVAKGAAVLDAQNGALAYRRVESSLFVAFTGMPELETPAKGPDRVFQLRTYESPSVQTGLKKIEMFNTAEIAIFRKVGLNPVFFGQALVGTKMPNLTYMLGFDNAAAQQEGWKKFGPDPDWQALRAKPEYADKKILCGITNIVLKPAEYSQV